MLPWLTRPVAGLIACLWLVLPFSSSALAGSVQTNAVRIASAPSWVTAGRVDRVVDRIQSLLEWDIRRITVIWYEDEARFERVHGYGPMVLAFARKSDNTVHVGPRVTRDNFDAVFGHELVHIISFQKYGDAIPRWLDEGLANYLAKHGKVDYAWLAQLPPVTDVHQLVHPFSGTDEHTRATYMASQALVEMIASKCDLAELLQLSVGKKLETYLATYCAISDINSEFRSWVRSKAPKTG